VVLQDPFASLSPRMRVWEIITEPMLVKGGISKKQCVKRAEELLELTGLPVEAAMKYPHQFSGGQRQRISIGRALASYPELIICDEPVSALDVAIQAQILNLFMDLQEKNNLTYLFISHDLGVVQHMCDDIGVMYLGRFAEVADKVSLFTSPAHPYTYSLLSVVPQVSRSPKGGRVKLLGDPPSPIDLKPGCRFNTRCPFAEDVCRHEEPELRKIGDNHFVACHLVRDGLGPHQRGGEWKV
jgi:oligopeptide/dipeptide ABC transporter ATP-binding protein